MPPAAPAKQHVVSVNSPARTLHCGDEWYADRQLVCKS